MARVKVPITEIDFDDGSYSAGTAIDTTNHHYLDTSKTDNLVLYGKNTGTVDGSITIAAGDNPPAFRSGLGALHFDFNGGSEVYIALESARHAQDDGTINIDIVGSVAGTLAAYRIPKL